MTRVAVAGATGKVGRLTVAALEQRGHEVVRISRSLGLDLADEDRVREALYGVEAVVDVTNHPAADRTQAATRFSETTRGLLAAEVRAGVGHHVLLSIAGLHRIEGTPHHEGKRCQERLVFSGPVPWTIVPATQFYDFAAAVAGMNERDGETLIPPLLVQPVACSDVAEILAGIATGPPQGRYPDVAGPDFHDLVDMARRTHLARRQTVKLIPTWSTAFGVEMAGDILLAGENAHIAPTTFEQWLAREVKSNTNRSVP
ncbi:SDR family oxidoreductase [Nonomuraea sp. CA-218870]|uniref:SDR family oxidoreductase n=1 Tax=Nonomuraea sp. CA-218870 TaxID=3239998 RepID=UPI003D8E9BF3